MKNNVFIFEPEGTILDTRKLHNTIISYLVKKHGGKVIEPHDVSKNFPGQSANQIFSRLAPSYSTKNLMNEQWENIYKLIDRIKTVDFLPKMYELLRVMYDRKIPMAIAATSPVRWVSMYMQLSTYATTSGEMKLMFHNRYVSAEDCYRPKPDTEVFEKAFQKATFGTGLKRSNATSYIIADKIADVHAGLRMNAKVLYVTEQTKTEFDDNYNVKIFSDTIQLYNYVVGNLL